MTHEADSTGKLGILALIIVILACGLGLLVLGTGRGSESDAAAARPDVISIDAAKAFGELQRWPSVFKHDYHVQVLQEAGEADVCGRCHHTAGADSLSFKFQRLRDDEQSPLKDIYHEGCVGCHLAQAAERAPGAEACGLCHQRQPAFVSSALPMVMDNSLHMRHVLGNQQKCELCHHAYDEQKQALVYLAGQESSCRDCHRAQAEGTSISFRQAAHQQCVNCHLRSTGTGPTDCAGCHDAARRQGIARLDPVPRLERHQPDMVLIHAALEDLPASKMPTVPFNHLAHEQYNSTCRICHHQGMKACRDCHTLAGQAAAGGITLAIAMHAPNVDHSCVGCHETRKTRLECLGCHTLMRSKGMAETYCQHCHEGPSADRVAAAGAGGWPAPELAGEPLMAPFTFPVRDVPDSVAISHLVHKYQAAVMPHRRIVGKLRLAIDSSPLARHFHGREDLVCQGCHHHSPVGMRPPSCANCHGQPFQPANLFSPGLYGAYHQQCVGCHQKMGLPAGCTDCHVERSEQTVVSSMRSLPEERRDR
jgi:hypothetical protein